MENIQQDEVKFRITSELEQGITIQHTKSWTTKVARNLSECQRGGMNFCNMLNRRKFSGHFLS